MGKRQDCAAWILSVSKYMPSYLIPALETLLDISHARVFKCVVVSVYVSHLETPGTGE